MIRVEHGDALDVLAGMEPDSVDAVCVDPPYELNFMSRGWDRTGVANRVETWAAVLRVLKPGGHMMCFGGTRTFHRVVCAIEDAGFEVRDTLLWITGSGFPKSHNVAVAIDKLAGIQPRGKAFNMKGRGDRAEELDANGREFPPPYEAATEAAKQWQGFGTALKPAVEMISLCRKPLSESSIARNVLAHGTGALNIDGCRVAGKMDGTWGAKQLSSIGFHGTQVTEYQTEQHAAGRWPANVAHDGSLEVLEAFGRFGESKSTGGKGQATAAGNKDGNSHLTFISGQRANMGGLGDTGTPARFFKECPFGEDDQCISAKNAGENINLASDASVSALSNAVAEAMAGLRLRPESFRAPSMSVTPSDFWLSLASVTAAIQNIALRSSLGLPPENSTVTSGPVRCAARPKPTDIMTITVSLWMFDGSVAPVTFSTTGMSLEHGGRASAQESRMHYSGKANASDRLGGRHPTIKPVALIRWLVRMITPPGGTVLDCFAGSGTTGMAAMREGFNAILVEREAEYIADINARLAHVSGADTPLFAGG